MAKTRKHTKKFLVRGGAPIASGSQGCIFLPALQLNAASKTAVRSANHGAISKVFTDKGVYDREFDIMNLVNAATGGVGVVVFVGGPNKQFIADKLNPENLAGLTPPIGTACDRVKISSPLYVINQPRIRGDVRDFQKTGEKRPASFFVKGYIALLRMRAHGLVHMDMASRNIFYNDTDALIGDFGYTLDLADQEQASAGLTEFGRSHGLGMPGNFVAQDQIMPEAFLALSLHKLWDRKKEIVRTIRDSIPYYQFEAKAVYDPIRVRDTEQGLIMIKDILYRKFEEVLRIAEETADANTFANYAFSILLNSDIKKYMIAVLKYMDIDIETKYRLLKETLVDEDFTAFLKFAAPGEVAAAAALTAVAAPHSAAAAAAAVTEVAEEAENNSENINIEQLKGLHAANIKFFEKQFGTRNINEAYAKLKAEKAEEKKARAAEAVNTKIMDELKGLHAFNIGFFEKEYGTRNINVAYAKVKAEKAKETENEGGAAAGAGSGAPKKPTSNLTEEELNARLAEFNNYNFGQGSARRRKTRRHRRR